MINIEKHKRKSPSSSIAQEVDLLQKLNRGMSVRRLNKDYDLQTSIIYNLKTQAYDVEVLL